MSNGWMRPTFPSFCTVALTGALLLVVCPAAAGGVAAASIGTPGMPLRPFRGRACRDLQAAPSGRRGGGRLGEALEVRRVVEGDEQPAAAGQAHEAGDGGVVHIDERERLAARRLAARLGDRAA